MTTTMKTMQDFAAQQLSKKQMNEVKGGEVVLYQCTTPDGRTTIITAEERWDLTDQAPVGTVCVRI